MLSFIEVTFIFFSILSLLDARRLEYDERRVSFGKWGLSDIQDTVHDACSVIRRLTIRREDVFETTLSASLASSVSLSHSPVKQAQKKFCVERLFRKIPMAIRNKMAIFPESRGYQVSVETFNTPDSESSIALNVRLRHITEPLIPDDIWETMTGQEFQQHPETLDQLTKTGAWLAENDEVNEWVDWKVFGSLGSLENGDIQVWTGKAKKEGHGSEVPFIKSRSILPMSPEEVVDLLLDSERVKTYNQWSQGRTDCWTARAEDGSQQQTKIVKSTTQPPLGAKPMVSVTLLHARPWGSDGGWIVVSRSPGGNAFFDPDDSPTSRSDILLGVNLLSQLDEESCVLTSLTHVYSPAIPAMLAERLGARSAIKFAIDVRNSKVPA
jgi:hypothetical protein